MVEPIARFTGRYRFLSNFYWSPIKCAGLMFPTVEHAFQASKCLYRDDKVTISELAKPGAAKRMGRGVKLIDDWDQIKLSVMLELVRRKFQVFYMQTRLLDTNDAELIEGNYWGDTFWGVCEGVGENHLGKILMRVRTEIKQ